MVPLAHCTGDIAQRHGQMAACMNDMPARKCLFACCGQGGHLVFSNDDRETTNYEGATRMSVVQIPLLVIVLSCFVMSCLSRLVLLPLSFSSFSLFFTTLQSRHDVFFFPSIRWPNVGAWGDRRPTGRSQPSIELRESFAYSVLGNNNLWAPGLARFGLGLGLGLLSICGVRAREEEQRMACLDGGFGWFEPGDVKLLCLDICFRERRHARNEQLGT